MTDYIKEMKKAFPAGKKMGGDDGDDDAGDGDGEAAAAVGFVPDLLEDAQVYQWAGIGFSQQELYRL